MPVFPVIAGREQLVGILSPSDISRVFLCLTASGWKGIELGIQAEDRPGTAMSIIDRIHETGGRIGSVVSVDSYAPKGFRQAHIHGGKCISAEGPGLPAAGAGYSGVGS